MQLRYILAQFNDRGKSPKKAAEIRPPSGCSTRSAGKRSRHALDETFGTGGTLGRKTRGEVMLADRLRGIGGDHGTLVVRLDILPKERVHPSWKQPESRRGAR